MPDLNFDKHNTLFATHGLHAYAAKCPPQLVKYGLRYYSDAGDKVLDPMSGSGTTLVQARLMGRLAIGYDIDPLARLIAKVKSQKLLDSPIEQAYEAIAKRSQRDIELLSTSKASAALRRRAEGPEFVNRDYWFCDEVASALAVLSYHIEHSSMSPQVRDFFWVAFSSLILAKSSVANARDIIHSRHHHWEHSDPPDVLAKFEMRVRLMRKQMAEFRRLCDGVPPAIAEARLGDARCLKIREETIDLVFTSPPYVTALDYTRAHFLAVAWMENALGLKLEDYGAAAPKYLGSERGRVGGLFEADKRLAKFELVQGVVTKLSRQWPRHANLAQRYFGDMDRVFNKIALVLKDRRHAIIVVCPSHIRKVKVPTQDAFIEIGREHGLRLKKKHVRTINERRRILPYQKRAFGKRMDTEYVLVFQKTS